MGENNRTLADNRRARHEYLILEEYTAGIMLTGTEIKSLRAGKANLSDSFARITDGEIFLHNMSISPYDKGGRENVDPLRKRKLLLNKQEITKLKIASDEKGLTLVPLRVFLLRGYAKVVLAIARGKKLYDKREAEAERQTKREAERALKGNLKNID